jgi:signal transduction histidine kinase/ligand-binding sensor domain-containing protein
MPQSPRRNLRRAVGVWLCCLLGVFLPLASQAKSSSARRDYLIDVWTTEKGLPNSSVTSIAQTPDGYLWVGTYNGLARFDGARFVTFEPEDTPELQHARIRKLFLDTQGTLWINTYDGSLTSWRNGVFKLEWRSKEYADYDVTRVAARMDHLVFLLPTGELIRRDLAKGASNDWRVIEPPAKGLGTTACEDAEGTLWYRGRDSQLWRMTGGQFELVTTNHGLPEATRVRAIAADMRGRLWVGSDRGIMTWANGRIENLTPRGGEATVDANFLFHVRDGSAWVVANEKLRKLDGGRWVEGVEPWEESLTGSSVMRLGAHEQADGTTWFYQYGLGLVCVSTDGATHRFTAEEGFPNDRVDCFFEDQEGNLWAGVNRGGLVRLRKQRFQVISVGEGSQSAVMQTVCQDASGAMWLGTAGSGLARWQDEKLSDLNLPGGSVRGFVFSAYPGVQDELWLSTGDEDLYVLANRRIERCSPWVHGVKVILASRDERTIWAGTKIGLFVCTNRATRSFAPYPGFPRTVDVRALAEASGGSLWAGGGDGNFYHVTTNGIEVLSPRTGEQRYPIWSLLLDQDETVWAGTFRGGLLRYRKGGFERFSVADGLPDSVISQLLSDEKDNLWMGSHQGIFRVARKELDAYARGERTAIASTVYGRLDGLPSLECSGSYQPACWRARDGRLWFATAAGVVAIQPDDATPNLRPPPVAIEEVLIDVKPQDLKSLGRQPSLVDPGKGRSREWLPVIEVPPGKRQFEFRFTALSFVSPDKVKFRYKLIGLEKDWVEAGPRRYMQYGYAQYSFLRPGDYQFQVTACNNEGVWNSVGSGVILHVQPHFYETKLFLLLTILSGAGLIILFARAIYRRRLRVEMERVERQRAVERDRARIAKDIHDDLGAGLTQITLLSELARRDPPEEVEGHVGQISGTARELTRAMDEIVWAINPQNDTLEGLITYVSKFAQQYLTVAGIRCRLDVPTELPVCVLGAEVRHNLYLAIKEALNNVVKHSHATVASLRLEHAHNRVTLTIEDDGQGLARNPGAPPTSGRTSSGHGLGNMMRRLEDIGGKCEVTDLPSGGTRVQFSIHVQLGGSPVLATGPAHPSE